MESRLIAIAIFALAAAVVLHALTRSNPYQAIAISDQVLILDTRSGEACRVAFSGAMRCRTFAGGLNRYDQLGAPCNPPSSIDSTTGACRQPNPFDRFDPEQ